jgi:hypothetical protein
MQELSVELVAEYIHNILIPAMIQDKYKIATDMVLMIRHCILSMD